MAKKQIQESGQSFYASLPYVNCLKCVHCKTDNKSIGFAFCLKSKMPFYINAEQKCINYLPENKVR